MEINLFMHISILHLPLPITSTVSYPLHPFPYLRMIHTGSAQNEYTVIICG